MRDGENDTDGKPVVAPDREITTGGNFGSAGAPQGFIQLQANEDLLVDQSGIAAPASSNHTYTVTTRGGGGAYTRVLTGPQAHVFRGKGIERVAIDSADSNVVWEKRPLGGFEHLFAGGQIVAFEGGTWNVNAVIQDGNGITLPTQYKSSSAGVVAPASGMWRFTALCTAATFPEIDNGGGAQDIVPDNGPATEGAIVAAAYKFSYPVNKGTTYKISADATVLDGEICVA